ncbi:uncharacterized protein LOC128146946 [Harpia harpyja]|uniref:uncharacterized protein LOC128146946 n=1 Tax=Harpia harpyja TaxID=202280 RepID=UPI0022B107D1|nr:uncharacterized protein LOC128146946 [Harpia harpyja]
MPPLVDPETPPLPPCPCRCPSRCRCRCRYRSRCRRLLLPVLGAAALGAAVAAATVTVILGVSPGGTPPQAATAAHMLLSAGSLVVPSGLGWRYEEGINGVFLSSDVQMTAGKLQVTAGGLYLFYGQFAVTCTASTCPPGTVTLQLRHDVSRHPLLTVPLALPDNAGSDPARSGLAQAVGQLRRGDVLRLELAGNISGDGWQLAQDKRESNFVGLLRIAGG